MLVPLTVRDFLDRAAAFTVAGSGAGALLGALSPDYALAQQVSFTDPDIRAEYIRYPSPEGHGQVRASLVLPAAAAAGPVPGVVVAHENRGLNPYLEDVARRLAKAGFAALAPAVRRPASMYGARIARSCAAFSSVRSIS